MAKFNYGNAFEKYDMSGEIKVGTGIVKVHDIFNPLPNFMMDADVVFCDPPYNQSALSSYYTKAEIEEKQKFNDFLDVLFLRFQQIEPNIIILESGDKQLGEYLERLKALFGNNMTAQINIVNSFYYGNKKNTCKIIIASKDKIPDSIINIPEVDEEKIIWYICEHLDFKCIADPCMGQGLVAFYANKYGKKFVGTELNYKRLAVCVDRVTTGKR